MQLETLEPIVHAYIKKLETNLREAQASLQEYKFKYLAAKEELDLLIYKRFARSAEQLTADKSQQLLFTEEAEKKAVEKEKIEYTEIKSHKRNRKGRKPIAEHIPRRDKIIDIPEDEKICDCGANLTKIGEETSEKVHITPPQLYVEKIIRPKYACRKCEGTQSEEKPTVKIMPAEPAMIPKSIVSGSLLTTVITQKYEMHLPYYRQEKQFSQICLKISRQNMANWQQKAYEKLHPLFVLLIAMIKSGPVMRMDETTVQVMGEDGRLDTQKSYMWLALGGPVDKPVALYKYHETRAAVHAKAFLEGYEGYLQTDGYEGYDSAIKDMPGIVHVGCFAHARRYFFEGAKISKEPKTAEEGIQYIRRLYHLENILRNQNLEDEKFQIERKEKADVILADFKQWLIKQSNEVPPALKLGKALNYSLSQWDKMVKYLDSHYLTPDNNDCENLIRPFVLGRKNWLFNKSPEGAESSCGMYSLIETVKLNGLIPRDYLMALFAKAPLARATEDWEKLLPWNIFTD
jgi:transposase